MSYIGAVNDIDKELVESIRKGKKSSFENVFKKYFPTMCLFSMRYIPDKDVAEDLVQEMFTKLWTNHQNLFITTSLESYLYRSVQNQALNFIKHEKIKGKYRQVVKNRYSVSNNTDEMKIMGFDIKEKIEKAVGDLPEKRREVFVMSRYEGMKYKEIAEKLKISTKTVEAHMGHALRQLKCALKDVMPLILILLTSFFTTS